MAEAGSNDEKNWRSQISLDSPLTMLSLHGHKNVTFHEIFDTFLELYTVPAPIMKSLTLFNNIFWFREEVRKICESA